MVAGMIDSGNNGAGAVANWRNETAAETIDVPDNPGTTWILKT
jgi:hypothetical protein